LRVGRTEVEVSVVIECEVLGMIVMLDGDGIGRNKIEYILSVEEERKRRNMKIIFCVYLRELFRQKYKFDTIFTFAPCMLLYLFYSNQLMHSF